MTAIDFTPMSVLQVIARVYETLYDAIMEALQNSIDAGAKRIEVIIDLSAPSITVLDNGKGCDRAEFSQKLAQIGTSFKKMEMDQQRGKPGAGGKAYLGQLGLGILAFCLKGSIYHFTSAPKAGKEKPTDPTWEGYTAHNLGNLQVTQGKQLLAPWQARSEFRQEVPWWNTCVQVGGLSQERRIFTTSDLKRLEKDVVTKYGQAMHRHGTVINVSFRPRTGDKVHRQEIRYQEYKGVPFKRERIRGEHAGMITFEIYGHDRPDGSVTLQMAGSDFRLPWKGKLVDTAIEWEMPKGAAEALTSGYLDGNIYADNVRITPNRRGIEINDAALELFAAVTNWMEREGVPYVRQAMSTEQDDREITTIHNILNELARLHTAGCEPLKDVISMLPAAGISSGHTKPSDSEEITGTVVGRSSATSQARPGRGSKTGVKNPRGEQISRLHNAVVHPNQGYTRYVTSGQMGITVGLEEMAGSSNPFRYEEERNILFINRRHPNYLKVRDNLEHLREYLSQLLLFAISFTSIPESQQEGAFRLISTVMDIKSWRLLNPPNVLA